MGRFQSGQMDQTVNLTSSTSVVRIHLCPPRKRTPDGCPFSWWAVSTEPPRYSVVRARGQTKRRFISSFARFDLDALAVGKNPPLPRMRCCFVVYGVLKNHRITRWFAREVKQNGSLFLPLPVLTSTLLPQARIHLCLE